jgi:hypothetical protein
MLGADGRLALTVSDAPWTITSIWSEVFIGP